MRPYLNWHGDPDKLNRYINKIDAEPIGGTVPNFSGRDLFRRFRALSAGDPRPEPFLHMTLSLPEGVKVARKDWLKIIKSAMKMLGLDPQMTPWFSKRHRDSECDHVHTAIVLRDYAGRPLSVPGSEKTAEDVHRHLCEMLGLPAPSYFDSKGSPRLDPITPQRRVNDPNIKALHQDLQKVFSDRQPETLSEFNAALSHQVGGFNVKMAENKHGVRAFRFTNAEGTYLGGTLGKAWEPRHLHNLLAFTGKLRRLRDKLDMDHLVQIFKTPRMEAIVAHILSRPDPARTATTPEDHPRSDQIDGQERPHTTRVARPSGPTRRSAGITGGDAGEPTERSVGSAGAVSGRIEQTHHSDERDRRTDQGNIRENPREPADTASEVGPDPIDPGTEVGLTVGALLARVCRLAASFTPGWRVRVLPNSGQIGIGFADKSAAIVNPTSARIVKDGAEALLFQTSYAADLEGPVEEVEAIPESDPDNGPEF